MMKDQLYDNSVPKPSKGLLIKLIIGGILFWLAVQFGGQIVMPLIFG